MGLSATHVILLLLVVVLLFGRGKISELMGDLAKGIKSFKKGMADDEPVAKEPPPRTIDQAGQPVEPVRDRTNAG
jgi:sec-independent protein translocase protein TatA